MERSSRKRPLPGNFGEPADRLHLADLRHIGDRPDTASEALNKGYSLAKPRLRAYKDVLVVISNYQKVNNTLSGGKPTAIRVEIAAMKQIAVTLCLA